MKAFVIAILLGSFLVESSRGALIAEVRTSAGNFSIELNYTGARRTVSHFMRLAEGLQPWLDEKTGRVQTGVPFYDGLEFYKKADEAPPFFPAYKKYLQVGARYPDDPFVFLPNEKQGAGYVIRDEIRYYTVGGGMVVPHGLYTVSMANNGPNSSSSQFFVNLRVDPTWDNRNSAFGTVLPQFIEYPEVGAPYVSYNGRAVVSAIHASQQTVNIISVTFRATDSIAAQFDSSQYATELPWVANRQITSVTHASSELTLGCPSWAFSSEVRVSASADLLTWTPAPTMTTFFPAGSTPSITSSILPSTPKAFYRSTSAGYPVSTVPANLYGKTIRIALNAPNATPIVHVLQLNFDLYNLTNTYYQYSDGSAGTFTYTLTPAGPYHADLVVTPDGFESKTYRLYFGGMNLDVTDNEQMHAEIINGGATPHTEARWYYVTP